MAFVGSILEPKRVNKSTSYPGMKGSYYPPVS